MASKQDENSYPDAAAEKAPAPVEGAPLEVAPLENTHKSRWERSWPTIACGAGLFSDGYLNGVCFCSVHGSQETYRFMQATCALRRCRTMTLFCVT